MGDFKYKEYTELETLIYNEAMDRIMKGLSSGLSFTEACEAVNVKDSNLKAFIVDDALKIMIADLHYTKGQTLQDTAEMLQLPVDVIQKAHREMMEDISQSAPSVYNILHPDNPAGSA